MEYNALRLDSIKSSSLREACKDSKRKILQSLSKLIGDCSVLIAKILTIREMIREAIWINQGTILVESDFQVSFFHNEQDSHVKTNF